MTSYSLDKASTVYIQRLIRNENECGVKLELDKFLQNCSDDEKGICREENNGFFKLFQRYISKSTVPFIWDEIQPFPRGALLDYNSFLIPSMPVIRSLLNKLVVIKLNGGLGTRMKCNGPKSLIPVINGLTFLDLSVQQIEKLNLEFGTNVPLVLMNSFSTINQTEQMINKYRNLRVKIYSFQQSRYPRIYSESLSLLPDSYDDSDKSAWYPPGHGNFYESFVRSGLIETFREQGKEYCFVSNIDNLGAIVDFRLLDEMTKSRLDKTPEFIMEVTNKTSADIKGGTLIHYMGKLKLLEYAEVPKDHIDAFKCSGKFNNFNTNNLWIKLDAIQRVVAEGKLSLDVIDNKKSIYKNGSKVDIIQLETAIGSAIQEFSGAIGILVPRSRFLPVKTTSDLFLLRSSIYVNNNGKLIMNPLRPFSDVPLVSLADEHFGDFRALDKRFENIPNCLDLNHLTVCGDVHFGKDIVLKGNVTIVANNGHRIDIPAGSTFQHKIVTGTLRIMDF